MFYDVIVIDSGCNVAQAEYVDMVNLTQNINPYDSIGHGSSIISIIKQKAPNIKILSVKISDSFDDVDLDSIIDALEFLIDNNYSCNIINMSLGTLTLSDMGKMKRLIDDLLNKGAVIVSSFNNDGYNSYPAVFDNVIGIDSTDECNNENDYYYLENCNVNVLGAFIYYRAKNHLNESTMVKGNSYTAANVTGIISNSLHLKSSEKNNLTLTKTILFQQAKKVYKIKGYVDSAKDGKAFVSQIKKAIVFPFNKEIHAIAKYESLINFEVVDYYDVRISGHVGNKISNINEFIDNEKIVKNITDLDWSGDFDTIICGHCGQLSKLLGKDLLEDIVQKCKKHRKLLYSFDSLSKYNYNFDQQSSCCFYSPAIEKQNVPLKNFGKLYISSKPVIGVYGTSSSQGKYSLQLQMRKILQENDYNVSQIGTEPSGYLFNMSFSYPIGYVRAQHIQPYRAQLNKPI